MGTLYPLGFSSGQLGAAVAEAVMHDVRVNDLGLQGFPQIEVIRTDGAFLIKLGFKSLVTEFSLTDQEALAATRALKSGRGHYEPIFDRVQEAAAKLEQMSNQAGL